LIAVPAATERLLGQDLWLAELETAGRDMERRIEEALRARPDLVNFLRGLGAELGSEEVEEPEPLAEKLHPENPPEAPLPSAEEVLRDLEEHLRRIKGDQDQPD